MGAGHSRSENSYGLTGGQIKEIYDELLGGEGGYGEAAGGGGAGGGRAAGRKAAVKVVAVGADPSCLRGLRTLDVLGKGDFGTVSILDAAAAAGISGIRPDGAYVLKEARLKSEDAVEQFRLECQLNTEIGALGIAPRVYDFWVCEKPDGAGTKYGYIVMDRLAAMYRKIFPDTLNDFPPSAIVNAPKAVQQAVIGVLEVMIMNNYVHHDNHLGNVGFDTEGRVKIFDFGFTKRTPFTSDEQRCIALGYSLYQLIEQMPYEVMTSDDNLFYDTIYLIRQSKYRFGTYMSAVSKKVLKLRV